MDKYIPIKFITLLKLTKIESKEDQLEGKPIGLQRLHAYKQRVNSYGSQSACVRGNAVFLSFFLRRTVI